MKATTLAAKLRPSTTSPRAFSSCLEFLYPSCTANVQPWTLQLRCISIYSNKYKKSAIKARLRARIPEKSELPKYRDTLSTELSKISHLVQGSATALDNLSTTMQDAEKIKHLAESLHANAENLMALRAVHIDMKAEASIGQDSEGETVESEPDNPEQWDYKTLRYLLEALESWQEVLRHSDLMTGRTAGGSKFRNLIVDRAVRNRFIELVASARSRSQDTTECWDAFLKSLQDAGVRMRAVDQMTKWIKPAEERHRDDNSVVLRGWGEELFLPQRLTWWALRKAWLRLKDLKLLTWVREYHDEDFEGWNSFQKRTGDMRIAAWELVMMKRDFDKKQEEAAMGIQEPVVGEKNAYVLQPDAIRRKRKEFMNLRWMRRRALWFKEKKLDDFTERDDEEEENVELIKTAEGLEHARRRLGTHERKMGGFHVQLGETGVNPMP